MTLTWRRTAALLLVPLALAACSGGDGEPAATAPSAATETAGGAPFAAQPGQTVQTRAFLDETLQAIRDEGTFALQLTTPLQGQELTMTGHADVSNAANPKAQLQLKAPGTEGGVDVIVVDDDVYVELPGSAGGGRYVQLSLAEAAAMSGQDLSTVMNPAEYLRAHESSISAITYAGQEEGSGRQLHRYTVDHAAAADDRTDGPGQATGGAAGAQTQVWLDGDKLIRKIDLDVGGTSVAMTLDEYGEPVQITTPPTTSVTTMPGLGDENRPTPPAGR